MLVIRFLRIGKKNQPFFRIVVIDKRKSSKAGRFTEKVGFWNPLTKQKSLKGERIKYWLSVGAKPSESIHNLLVEEKIIENKKIPVHKKSKKETGKPVIAETPKEITPEITPEINSEAVSEKSQEVVSETSSAVTIEKIIEDKKTEEKPAEEIQKTE